MGAGAGLGSRLARVCAAEGLAVCLMRRPRHVDDFEALAGSIRERGGQPHAFAIDPRVEADIAAEVDRREVRVAPLEVMIFNIGANMPNPASETTERI